jgi:hypothetical protein
LPRELAAQPTVAPRRFIALLSQSGQINTHWYPTHVPAGYQLRDDVFSGEGRCPGRPCKQDGTTHLHESLPEDGRYAYAPLTDFESPTGLSTVLHESLNPFLPKMNLVRGLDFMSTVGHSRASSSYLGNFNDSSQGGVRDAMAPMPTIDQVMAYSDRVYPVRPATRSLHLSAGSASGGSATDYGIAGGPVEIVDGYQDPLRVWEDLFQGLMVDETPREDPNVAFLNDMHEDYRRLSANPRLSRADRDLLERHIGFLSDIEAGLTAFRGAECFLPETPPSLRTWHLQEDPDILRNGVALLIDLAVAAMACDLTRVVTIKISNAAHDGAGTWQTSRHNSADVPSDWHHFAHDAFGAESSMRNLDAINRWIADEVFARLLSQLDVPEGTDGSTMLDNSLVVWGNELSLSHYNITMPTVTAGSCGGAILTNRYLDYCNWTGRYANPIDWGVLIPGVPHNRFLVSCMQAMGLEPGDYERDGLAGYGGQEMVSTPNGWSSDLWDLAAIGDPLPGFLA